MWSDERRRDMRTRSPFAPAFVVLVVLVACGSSARTARAPATIHVVSSGAAAQTAGAGADSKRAAAAAASGPNESFGPYTRAEYVADGALPALLGEAPAWRYPAASGVASAQVTSLAKALGLSGPVVALDKVQGAGWRVGPADGTAPSVVVMADALGSWYYDGGGEALSEKASCADVPVATDRATGEPPTTIVMPGCAAPTPPANVPSQSAATEKAATLAAKLGLEPAPGSVEAFGDDWGVYVTWSTAVDGAVVPISWSASFGAGGALTAANGMLATPEKATPYPRIGTAKALEVLNATASYGMGVAVGGRPTAAGGFVATEVAPAPTAAPGSDGSGVNAVPPSPGSGGSAPNDEPPVTTGPPPTAEPPAPTIIRVTGAEASLYVAYDVSGDVWLVPGYRFTTAQGEVLAPAIDASYLDAAGPAAVGPAVVPLQPPTTAP
jgi:hypothetical protein